MFKVNMGSSSQFWLPYSIVLRRAESEFFRLWTEKLFHFPLEQHLLSVPHFCLFSHSNEMKWETLNTDIKFSYN